MKKILPAGAILVPDGAECVFKGEIFDVYQWQQELFDGSKATFEMLKRPDTVQILAIKDGQLVMVDDEQPGRSSQIHFPGGRVDETDESWLAAAKREMLEETGMEFRDWKLVGVYQPAPKLEQFGVWFLAQNLTGETEPHVDPGEKISVQLMSFEDVRAMVIKGGSFMSYALPLFINLKAEADLLALPEFTGQEIDR